MCFTSAAVKELKGKDEKRRWSAKKRTRLEPNGCTGGSGTLYSGKKGISGQGYKKRKKKVQKQKHETRRGADNTAPLAPHKTIELERVNELCGAPSTGQRSADGTAGRQEAELGGAQRRQIMCQLMAQVAGKAAMQGAAVTSQGCKEAIAGQEKKKKQKKKQKK
jgi:hypothetical protein